jgi:hypothetical protein
MVWRKRARHSPQIHASVSISKVPYARIGRRSRIHQFTSVPSHQLHSSRPAYILLASIAEAIMSLVRLLGFTTLACGCVVGRYREVATSREVTYVEEKGKTCGSHGHRRNHTIAAERLATVSPLALATKAS